MESDKEEGRDKDLFHPQIHSPKKGQQPGVGPAKARSFVGLLS